MLASERAVRAWAAAAGAHDLAAYRAAVTPDYTWTLGAATTAGAEASVEAWALLFAAFPDLRFELRDVLAAEGRAAYRFAMGGTHRGPLRFRGTASFERPLPPTGRAFAVEGAGWAETEGARVARTWAFWQPAEMLRQLGLA